MKSKKILAAAIIAAAMPFTVSATVLINEIAWMGTIVAPQDEWLELKNDSGENIDLTGWILTIEGVRDIILDKSIIGVGYYLIERTDDNTVPTVTADLVSPFGNGLNNSGATLILKNASGTEVDRVVSGENWTLGGNNTTKDTAQRTASGWITAPSTPRAANASASSQNSSSSSSSSSNNQSQSSNSNQNSSSAASVEERPEMKVEIVANQTAVSGADALFSGKALGAGGKPLDNFRFLWNFGDGETREGQNVLHRFRFPGEYIVMLDVAYGKWSAAARLTITAIKSPLIISQIKEGTDGFVEIANEGNAELDLFGWYLKSGNVTFLIPKNTIIAAGKKIIFPNEVTKLNAVGVLLLYPNGVVTASYEEPAPALPPASFPESDSGKPQDVPIKIQVKPVKDEVKEEVAAVYEATKVAEATPRESGLGIWLLALGGLIVVSLGAFLFSKQKPAAVPQSGTSAGEYEIIE